MLATRNHARYIHRTENLWASELCLVGAEDIILLGLLSLYLSFCLRLCFGLGLWFGLGLCFRLCLRLCFGFGLGLGFWLGLTLVAIKIDLTQNLGLGDLLLNTDDVALDDDLLLYCLLLAFAAIDRDRLLLAQRDLLAYVVALLAGNRAIRAELLLQNGVHVGRHLRIG